MKLPIIQFSSASSYGLPSS